MYIYIYIYLVPKKCQKKKIKENKYKIFSLFGYQGKQKEIRNKNTSHGELRLCMAQGKY